MDLLLLVVNRGVDFALLAVTAFAVAAIGDSIRITSLWPSSLPVALQVLLGIVIAEFVRYGIHRYSHRQGFWWRIHRTHHEPQRMYSLNGPRLHPLNYVWVSAAHGVPMLLLGAPLEVVLVVMNLTALFVVFQHANLRLRFTMLVAAGVRGPQLIALVSVLTGMLLLFCVEAWYGRRKLVSESWLLWSLRLTLTALCLGCALSGGLHSPFLSLTFAPVVVAFAAFGRRRSIATLAAYATVLLLGLALIPVGSSSTS